MSRRLVARRYAKALALIGLQQGSLLDLQAELGTIRSLVEAHPDLRRLVGYALIAPAQKAAAFDAVLDRAGASATTRNFFRVVAGNARLDHLFEILDAFDHEVDERAGIREARVSSAQPLTDAQLQALEASLALRTGKRIRTRWALDPALLGGLKVQVGSTVYDASILGRLHQLKNLMLSASS